MVDGSDLSLDTAMYIHSEGGERLLVPVRPDVPAQANLRTEPEPEPEPAFCHDFQQVFDHHDPPPKNRYFYMKEFVARVDGILQAMQAREALPDSTICADCFKSLGHWRCDNCVGGKLLCRFCMRHSHFSNPFHRIECWTGTHFRNAALWEVGVYLTLPHQNGGICTNLIWQKQMLDKFQKKKDEVITNSAEESIGMDYFEITDSGDNPELEAFRDDTTMQYLDQLLAGQNPDEIMEEDDTVDLVDTQADVHDMDAGRAGFTNYMNERLGHDLGLQTQDGIPNAPNCDALDNQYIRVVHTNGIHHIALVCCTCQGHENITTDLIYAGWVPTSFVRV